MKPLARLALFSASSLLTLLLPLLLGGCPSMAPPPSTPNPPSPPADTSAAADFEAILGTLEPTGAGSGSGMAGYGSGSASGRGQRAKPHVEVTLDMPAPAPKPEPHPPAPPVPPAAAPKATAATATVAHQKTAPTAAPAAAPAEDLQPAKVAWNTPGSMLMGESATITLRVTLNPAHFDELAKHLPSSGTTQATTLDLSSQLSAELGSTDFDITPPGKQAQQVLEGRDVEWKWIIQPKVAGERTLLLTIYSALNGGAQIIQSLDRKISVAVLTPPPEPAFSAQVLGFALKNWDKLLTLILIPLAGWVWKRFGKKNEAS
ncbi:MAG: hypothetical protein AB3X41_00515 [Leptothrix ochracea]|uniref:hypothetical protein n=1 Tax=Leptothrix ochracea TaxID=735331 RepID=UPI0034E1EC18